MDTRKTATDCGLNNSEQTNMADPLSPMINQKGDMPLRYSNRKKEKKTSEDPKSGCSKMSSAGPKNSATASKNIWVSVMAFL